MEFDKVVEGRRSIRRYQDKEVSKEMIEQLIQFTRYSPSWKNSQVSRYHIALTKGAKVAVIKGLADFNQNNVKDASAIIVSTVVDKRSGFDKQGQFSTHLRDGFQYFDNGLQVQTLCLKAYEMGLGTLIMGIYDEATIRAALNIPEDQIIVAIIGLGYPNIEPDMPMRKNVEEVSNFY